METYEANFYQPENLEGCIRDAHGNARVLCFKDPQTHTLGRIVLKRKNPFDPNENIGRTIVFADITHCREEVGHQAGEDPETTQVVERIDHDFLLHVDDGRFEAVSDENREELTNLIDRQQGLMEGHKGILKGALDIFDRGIDALNPEMSGFIGSTIVKSYQHIISTNNFGIFGLNHAKAGLSVHCQNAPQIGWHHMSVRMASAYHSNEFYVPYGQGRSDIAPYDAEVVQAQFSGTPEQWAQLQEDQLASPQASQSNPDELLSQRRLRGFMLAQQPEEGSLANAAHAAHGHPSPTLGANPPVAVAQPIAPSSVIASGSAVATNPNMVGQDGGVSQRRSVPRF